MGLNECQWSSTLFWLQILCVPADKRKTKQEEEMAEKNKHDLILKNSGASYDFVYRLI